MALFDLVQPRVCELGKIKIGGKDPQARRTAAGRDCKLCANGTCTDPAHTWRMPKKLDHFLITTLHRDHRGDLIPDTALMDSLKPDYADPDGKLRQLPVAVLSDDIEDILQASYVWYAGRRVAARSDGVELTKFYDHQTRAWLKEPQVVEWRPEYADLADAKGNKFFKLHTIFSCVMAVKKAHWGGVYRFRTTSQITAGQLAGSLLEIKQLTAGVLRGLPLRLALRPLQVTPNGIATTVYVVHCELIGEDLLQLQNMAMERARHEVAYATQIKRAQLEYKRLIAPPGVEESPSEQSDVAEEFHPEENGPPTPETAPPDPLLEQLGLMPPAPPAKDEPKPVPPQPPAPVADVGPMGPPAELPDDDVPAGGDDALAMADTIADLESRIEAAGAPEDMNAIGRDMVKQRDWLGAEYKGLLEMFQTKWRVIMESAAPTQPTRSR